MWKGITTSREDSNRDTDFQTVIFCQWLLLKGTLCLEWWYGGRCDLFCIHIYFGPWRCLALVSIAPNGVMYRTWFQVSPERCARRAHRSLSFFVWFILIFRIKNEDMSEFYGPWPCQHLCVVPKVGYWCVSVVVQRCDRLGLVCPSFNIQGPTVCQGLSVYSVLSRWNFSHTP
jgi:hypothetical protein